MNEDNLNLEPENESNDIEINDLDPITAEAMEKGWKPQEEWEGDPKDWRDARTFLDRESFFKKIKSQNREIGELRSALNELGKLQANIAKKAREDTIKELQVARREALQNDNLDEVDRLNDQIAEIKAAPAPQPVVPQPTTNPELEDFMERNPWFNQDPDLREMAEGIALKYITTKQQNSQPITAADVYSHVETKMAKVIKKETPKVADPVTQTSTVVTRSPTRSTEKKTTIRDLPDWQRTIARRMVEAGAFKDVQEYVDQLVATGGL